MTLGILTSALLWLAVAGLVIHGSDGWAMLVAACAGLVSGLHLGTYAARREAHGQCERAAKLLRANQTVQGVSEEMVNDVLGILYGRW